MQVLKALAFLGIFLSHAKYSFIWYALGVSVFFVLSGFLMMHVYDTRELTPSLKNNAVFSIRKVRKLYPLHLTTMMFFVVLNLLFAAMNNRMNLKSVAMLLGKIGLNVTLLQAWVPYNTINTSLNSVAWYLSVMMFLYFIFPWLHGFIRKTSLNTLSVICLTILCLEIISCIVFLYTIKNENIYVWFMYHSPIFRAGDFFVGGVLAKWYFERDFSSTDVFKASVCEITAAIITVLVLLWAGRKHDGILLSAVNNLTTIYIPLAASWVFLFAMNRGIITKLLVNKPLVFMGNLCAYLFFFNYVVTEYVYFTIKTFKLDIQTNSFILVVFELAVTILLSIGYKKIESICATLFRKDDRNKVTA